MPCHGLWRGEAVFGDGPDIDRVLLCEMDSDHATRMAHEFGFARATNNWRDLLTDPAIQFVSITSPNGLHRQRPMASGGGGVGQVENDNIAHAVVRFRSGARGTLSSSRIAHGRKNG